MVLVDTPTPWPKPALAHPLLTDLAAVLKAGPVPTRLLAAIGPGFGSVEGAPVAVVLYRRQGGAAIEERFGVADSADLAAWGRALVADLDLSPWRLGSPSPSPAPARPAVLICTQGSHDVCCGADGVRFATEAEAALDVDVYRVSHTGGHRFAPTALTFPDGRMWADLDLDALRAILAEAGDVDAVADRCRGWWGAETGPAQVAERAVWAELGWEANEADRTVEIGPPPTPPSAGTDRDRFDAVVTVADETWAVELAAGRTVPTIACRQPGGLPAKEAREYDVLSVRRA
ncbi:MAG: sucrase ferredoxin [Actinomycetota bacterium]